MRMRKTPEEGKAMKINVLLAAAAVLLLHAMAAMPNGMAQTANTSKSPAASLGMFAYPKNNQPQAQQARDEQECLASAKQQSGVDPSAPGAPPAAPEKKKGGAVKGAAGGAAGGAAIGAIAGDAGTGAAVGATAGAIRGRRQQKRAQKEAEKQAQAAAKSTQEKSLDSLRRAFSACMDARGYSVK